MKSTGPLKRAIAGFLGLDYNQITIHAFGRFIERTRNASLRQESAHHKMVPIDFVVEDANWRVKHGNFERGLPTQERIKKFVLTNDRITSELVIVYHAVVFNLQTNQAH